MIDIQNHIRNEGLPNLFDGQGVKPAKVIYQSEWTPVDVLKYRWVKVACTFHASSDAAET